MRVGEDGCSGVDDLVCGTRRSCPSFVPSDSGETRVGLKSSCTPALGSTARSGFQQLLTLKTNFVSSYLCNFLESASIFLPPVSSRHSSKFFEELSYGFLSTPCRRSPVHSR